MIDPLGWLGDFGFSKLLKNMKKAGNTERGLDGLDFYKHIDPALHWEEFFADERWKQISQEFSDAAEQAVDAALDTSGEFRDWHSGRAKAFREIPLIQEEILQKRANSLEEERKENQE